MVLLLSLLPLVFCFFFFVLFFCFLNETKSFSQSQMCHKPDGIETPRSTHTHTQRERKTMKELRTERETEKDSSSERRGREQPWTTCIGYIRLKRFVHLIRTVLCLGSAKVQCVWWTLTKICSTMSISTVWVCFMYGREFGRICVCVQKKEETNSKTSNTLRQSDENQSIFFRHV